MHANRCSSKCMQIDVHADTCACRCMCMQMDVHASKCKWMCIQEDVDVHAHNKHHHAHQGDCSGFIEVIGYTWVRTVRTYVRTYTNNRACLHQAYRKTHGFVSGPYTTHRCVSFEYFSSSCPGRLPSLGSGASLWSDENAMEPLASRVT